MSRNEAKRKGAAKKCRKGTKKKHPPKKSEKKPAEKRTTKLTEMPATEPTKKDQGNDGKKPVDMVQARENVSSLVRESAAAIANGVITVAKGGQLASAKYLFEAVGLYPAMQQTTEKPAEDSLAKTLLQRMGLPLEPVVTDEDEVTSEAPRADTSTGREEKQRLAESEE